MLRALLLVHVSVSPAGGRYYRIGAIANAPQSVIWGGFFPQGEPPPSPSRKA